MRCPNTVSLPEEFSPLEPNILSRLVDKHCSHALTLCSKFRGFQKHQIHVCLPETTRNKLENKSSISHVGVTRKMDLTLKHDRHECDKRIKKNNFRTENSHTTRCVSLTVWYSAFSCILKGKFKLNLDILAFKLLTLKEWPPFLRRILLHVSLNKFTFPMWPNRLTLSCSGAQPLSLIYGRMFATAGFRESEGCCMLE